MAILFLIGCSVGGVVLDVAGAVDEFYVDSECVVVVVGLGGGGCAYLIAIGIFDGEQIPVTAVERDYIRTEVIADIDVKDHYSLRSLLNYSYYDSCLIHIGKSDGAGKLFFAPAAATSDIVVGDAARYGTTTTVNLNSAEVSYATATFYVTPAYLADEITTWGWSLSLPQYEAITKAAKDPEWTLMNAASALDLADEEEFGGVVVAESFGIKSGAWTVDLGEVWLEFADYAADKPVHTLTGKEVVDFKFSDYYTMAWYTLLVSDETAWEHYGDTQAAARTNFVNFLQDKASGNAEDSYTTPFFRKDGANFCLDFAEAETYDPDSPVEVEPEVVYYEWTPGVKTTIVTYTASEVQILAE